MEARFGTFRKIVAALSILTLIFSGFQTFAAKADADEKLSLDLVWESVDTFESIIGSIGNKVLFYESRFDKDTRPTFRLINIENGSDDWDGTGNDLNKVNSSKIISISMEEMITLHDGKILMQLDDGLHCYDFFNGNQLWFAQDSKNWLPPRFFEDNIGYTFEYLDYINKPKVKVVELDIETGMVVASFEFEPEDVTPFKFNLCRIISKYEDDIIYHDYDNLYKTSIATGKTELLFEGDSWYFYSDKNFFCYKNVFVANHNRFCCDSKHPYDWNEIFGIDVTTGKVLWSKKASSGYRSFGKYMLFKYHNICGDEQNSYLCLADIETGKVVNKIYGKFLWSTMLSNDDIFINEDYYGAFIDQSSGKSTTTQTVISVFDIKTQKIVKFSTNQYKGNYFHIARNDDGMNYLLVKTEATDDYKQFAVSCFRINDGTIAETKIESKLLGKFKMLANWKTYVVAYDFDDLGEIGNTYIIDTRTNIVEPSKSKLASFLVGKKLSDLEYSTAGRYFCVYQKDPKIKSILFYSLDTGELSCDNGALKDCFLPTAYKDEELLTSCFTGAHFKVVRTRKGRGLGWYHIPDQKKVFKVVAFDGSKIVIFDDKLSVFDVKSEKRLWSFNGSFADGFKPEDVKIVGNSVLLNTKDVKQNKIFIQALDASNGKALWSDEADVGFKIRLDAVCYIKTFGQKKEMILAEAANGRIVSKSTIDTIGFSEMIPLLTKNAVIWNEQGLAKVEFLNDFLEPVGSVDLEDKTVLNACGCNDSVVLQLQDKKTNEFSVEILTAKW